MLTKLIPPQYRLLAIGVIASFLLGAGFGSGWSVNGWRLSGKIETLKADLATCKANTTTLTKSIDLQNVQIDAWKATADKKLEASKEALRAAEEQGKETQAEIAELLKERGSTCAEAEQLIDKGLGL